MGEGWGGTRWHPLVPECSPEPWGAPASGGLGLGLSGDLFLFLFDDRFKWKERGAVSTPTPLRPEALGRTCFLAPEGTRSLPPFLESHAVSAGCRCCFYYCHFAGRLASLPPRPPAQKQKLCLLPFLLPFVLDFFTGHRNGNDL